MLAVSFVHFKSKVLGVILLALSTTIVMGLTPNFSLAQVTGAPSNESLKLVTVTGRAAIMHKDAVDEARDMALEDALYYAALKGGAKIDGFSSVDSQII